MQIHTTCRHTRMTPALKRVLEDPGIGHDRRAVVARELGFAQISIGQVAEAITSYEDSLAAMPTSMAHQNLALVLLGLDRLSEAETHMRSAIQLQPYDAEAYGGLGAVLARQGRNCLLHRLHFVRAEIGLAAVELAVLRHELRPVLGEVLEEVFPGPGAEEEQIGPDAGRPGFACSLDDLAELLGAVGDSRWHVLLDDPAT